VSDARLEELRVRPGIAADLSALNALYSRVRWFEKQLEGAAPNPADSSG